MKQVLFVCTHNAGRSQMAQALFERHAPADFRALSAGSSPAPTIWPAVVEAMREIDIDLVGRRPQKLTPELQLQSDWAVTMGCEDTCPYVLTTVEAWDVPDPAGRPIEEVRAIRDGIERRVRELVDTRLDAIRQDRTTHELLLGRLLPALDEEFQGRRTNGEIRACADAVLSGFSDARVRSHVLTIALRRTQKCLRAETCDALYATVGGG